MVIFKVQKALAGMRYPADKQRLLEWARRRGADEPVLRVLELIADEAYASPVALSVEVSRQLARLRRSQ